MSIITIMTMGKIHIPPHGHHIHGCSGLISFLLSSCFHQTAPDVLLSGALKIGDTKRSKAETRFHIVRLLCLFNYADNE